MSAQKPTEPHQQLLYRANPNCQEKVIFFSKEAVDRAVAEGRLPAEKGNELKEVLEHPNEVAAILEWNGIADYQVNQKQQTSQLLLNDVAMRKALGSRWSH